MKTNDEIIKGFLLVGGSMALFGIGIGIIIGVEFGLPIEIGGILTGIGIFLPFVASLLDKRKER